jgi:hypothetical protein
MLTRPDLGKSKQKVPGCHAFITTTTNNTTTIIIIIIIIIIRHKLGLDRPISS